MRKFIIFFSSLFLILFISLISNVSAQEFKGSSMQKVFNDANIMQGSSETSEENEENVSKEKEEVFVAVEQPGEFPGGQAALMKWMSQHLRYPETALQNNIHGRVVVKFIIEKDSTISNVQIARSAHENLDNEALRLVNNMPNWIPAKNNGESVRSYFNLPVTFKPQ